MKKTTKLNIAARTKLYLPVVFLLVASVAQGDECNQFLHSQYIVKRKILENIPAANIYREKKRTFEARTNWSYKLSRVLGDKAMQSSMESALHEVRIDPKLAFDSIYRDTFDAFTWADILRTFSNAQAERFISHLSNLGENYLVFYKNFTQLTNLLIEKNILSYEQTVRILEAKNNELVFYSFSPIQRKVSFNLNYNEEFFRIVEGMIERSRLSPELKQEWSTMLLYKAQDAEILMAIDNNLQELPNYIGYVKLFSHFLDYLGTMKKEQALKVARNVQSLLKGGFKPEPLAQRILPVSIVTRLGYEDNTLAFFRQEKKIQNYENRIRKQYEKKYRQYYAGPDTKKMLNEIESEVHADTSFYRGILNQCSKNMRGIDKRSPRSQNYLRDAKRFRTFKILSGISLTTIMYSYFHWDSPEKSDITSNWYKKVAYDGVWSVYSALVGTSIVVAKSTSLLSKFMLKYLTSTAGDIPYSIGYEALVGVKDEDSLEKFNQIKCSADYKEQVGELVKEFEHKRLGRQIVDEVENVFRDKKLPSGQSLLDAIQTEEDLEKPEVKEAILELISQQVYEDSKENTSSYFKTGYRSFDVWWFQRHWGVIEDFKSVVVGLYVFNTICKNTQNPGKAYLAASVAVITEKLISRAAYYGIRKHVIQE
ncbi:MAG: hypothetical protein JNM93_08360 [Bacteriovoracaceae bacterium]|nr:hypothetical protein [Bacteriovoracaceae bacterium]